jgi:hypothetical protein
MNERNMKSLKITTRDRQNNIMRAPKCTGRHNNVMDCFAFLTPVAALLCSNFDPEIGYLEVFRGFPQFLQAHARIVLYIRPRLFPFTSTQIHYSLANLPFNVT